MECYLSGFLQNSDRPRAIVKHTCRHQSSNIGHQCKHWNKQAMSVPFYLQISLKSYISFIIYSFKSKQKGIKSSYYPNHMVKYWKICKEFIGSDSRIYNCNLSFQTFTQISNVSFNSPIIHLMWTHNRV